jgi:hypothetical protein
MRACVPVVECLRVLGGLVRVCVSCSLHAMETLQHFDTLRVLLTRAGIDVSGLMLASACRHVRLCALLVCSMPHIS